jgi:hypothetical protein
VTFKDLARLVTDNLASNRNSGYQHAPTSHVSSTQIKRFTEQFCQKQFWIWADIIKHKSLYIQTNGNCCFNHIICSPQKNGQEYPLFDYEKFVIDAIENNQHIWIKKARGIGITELILR